MAGTAVLIAAVLSAVVNPWFLVLVAFVGVNQWLYVIAGNGPASLILARVFGLKRGSDEHHHPDARAATRPRRTRS